MAVETAADLAAEAAEGIAVAVAVLAASAGVADPPGAALRVEAAAASLAAAPRAEEAAASLGAAALLPPTQAASFAYPKVLVPQRVLPDPPVTAPA